MVQSTTGGVISGTLGVLAGMGALAAGPIRAGLAGLGVGGTLGGLVGALVGWNAAVGSLRHAEEISRAKDMLKGTGAEDIASASEGRSPRTANSSAPAR
jgi:hypothetical protein